MMSARENATMTAETGIETSKTVHTFLSVLLLLSRGLLRVQLPHTVLQRC